MVDVNRLVVLLGIDGLHCRNREMTSVFLNYYCLVKIRFSSLLTSSCVEKIVLEYMCKQVIITFFSKKKVSWSNASWNYMHLCKPGGVFFKQNCYNDQMVKLYLLLSFAFVRHTNLCIFICNIRLTYLKRIFWRYKSIMHKTKAMNINSLYWCL